MRKPSFTRKSESVYEAAQKFLIKHDLPLGYMDEVVRFIDQNTASAQASQPNQQYVDPYTGASRYQSSATPAAAANTTYNDPFTGM